MNMIHKSYQEFILEKQENYLLELLNESIFIMSTKMGEIIEELKDDEEDYSKIANCFYLLDMEDLPTNISYLDMGDDNSTVTFLNPDKVDKIRSEKDWTISDVYKNIKGSAIKVGRLTRKVIELYAKYKKIELNFTDKQIEDFVNAYKAQYDFSNNIMDNFELLSDGKDIEESYLEDNYYSEDGTLGGSCMRYEECQGYFSLYTETSVNLLVLRSANKKVMGRSVIWTLIDGRQFMDRVYTNRDSDVDLFIKYAKENKFIYKQHQNSSSNSYFYIPDDNYKETHQINLESKVYKFNINYKEDTSFPYMDTMKFLYWKDGVIRNYAIYDNYFVELEDTDGWCSCGKCGGDGNINCEECDGDGNISCEECGGDGNISCEECVGDECSKCDGDGEISCEECGGDGYCECNKCGDDGTMDCTRCGGYSNKWDY